MENTNRRAYGLVGSALVVGLVVGGMLGYYYGGTQSETAPTAIETTETPEAANPYAEIETNPYNNVKVNPFE